MVIRLIVKIIKTGYLQENCYLLVKNNNCLIIDPGDDEQKIIKEIGNLNVLGILITHHHFDHIGALEIIKNKYQIKEINNNIKEFPYKIIKTPGHSKDSLTFYFEKEKIMFVGDFIFNNGLGRIDLPTGSLKDMQDSLKIISEYPDNIKIYPGHGDSTTLKAEKKNFNSFY